MKETMVEIIDEITDQEIVLARQGFRPGFILVGLDQFIIMINLYKKEDLVPFNEMKGMDGNIMMSGYLVVPDKESKDRFDLIPESSVRTDSIMRSRRDRHE